MPNILSEKKIMKNTPYKKLTYNAPKRGFPKTIVC